ncbi:hypothetical protein ACH4T9_12595 [Micromonospora sp. NPDC020750]|uniref:hypothetical protein n=1 Tax=unclassified Micromonospora TaxID=2617518 RepID=UPI00379265F6
MTARTYWQGQQFVTEWTLRELAGQPVTDATVSGEVTRPDGSTAAMTVTADGGLYLAVHLADAPGTHSYRLSATGTAQDAVEGQFVVGRELMSLPSITLDPTGDIGMIRLLITDVDETTPLFEDAQLDALLRAEAGNVKRGSAAALEIIATSETLIGKKIATQDLSTDAPAVARELMNRAKALRDQAAAEQQDGGTAPAQGLLPLYSFPTPASWGDSYL